jgi:hypothetical protein
MVPAKWHPTPAAYGGAACFCSFVKRLINRHGSHVKASGTTLRSVSNRRVGSLSLEILAPSLVLILDNSDASRGRSWCYLSFGCLSQLFELTFLPTSLKGTTP